MIEENELPQGWVWTTLEIVCDKIQDGSHFSPKVQYDVPGEGRYPYITAKNIRENGLDLSNLTYVDYSFHKLIYERCKPEVGDVLLTKDGVKTGVATINSLDGEFSLLSSVALLKANKQLLNSYYLKQYLNSPIGTKMITGEMTGTAIKRIVLNKIYVSPIPLAPLAEQQRIVEAIEQQFSRLDAGIASLRSAQKKLKLYRASVLKAAVEGELTAEWRAANPPTEPASALLERILKERRERWEEEQRAKGRDPKKQQYVEPAAPDVSKLSMLPEGWCWVALECVANSIDPHPSHRTPPVDQKGIPYVSIGDITKDGKLDLQGARKVSNNILEEHKARYQLRLGDFIFGKIGTLGKPFKLTPPFEYALSANVVLIQPNHKSIDANFVFIYMSSPFVESLLIEGSKATTQAAFGIQKVRILPFPFPPLAEQEQIVTLVEERMSIINELEATIEKALKRAELQRQSILHQAFTGKLVPQDPDDEPSSVLLERIQHERDQNSKKVKANSHGATRKRTVRKEESVRIQETQAEPIDTRSLVQQGLW